MTSITNMSSIQSAGVSTYKQEELSSSTKLKLEALGIDCYIRSTGTDTYSAGGGCETTKQRRTATTRRKFI